MSAESVDVAEHSFTLDSALDGGLSTRLTGRPRAALHDLEMHLLNGIEKCPQNAPVIHPASQVDLRELELLDRGDVDTPRRVSGNGVGDRQEMA